MVVTGEGPTNPFPNGVGILILDSNRKGTGEARHFKFGVHINIDEY